MPKIPEVVLIETASKDSEWVSVERANREVWTNGEFYLKFGGRDWNCANERAWLRHLYGEDSATVFKVNGRPVLLTRTLGSGAQTEDEIDRVWKAVPETIEFIQSQRLPDVRGLSRQSPLDALKERVAYRRTLIDGESYRDELRAYDELIGLLDLENLNQGVPAHGDIHSGNILLNGDKFALIDFEWASVDSCPEYDWASFVHHAVNRDYNGPIETMLPSVLNESRLVACWQVKALSSFTFAMLNDKRELSHKILDRIHDVRNGEDIWKKS